MKSQLIEESFYSQNAVVRPFYMYCCAQHHAQAWFFVDPPGSRLPLHLASVSRSLAQQHIADRINLISAQNDLNAPSRAVSSLMILAVEVSAKLVYLLYTTASHDQRPNSNSS